MAEVIEIKEILSEMKKVRQDLDYIKDHMVDIDMIMTVEEEERLQESLIAYKEGKATPLDDFEKEIND